MPKPRSAPQHSRITCSGPWCHNSAGLGVMPSVRCSDKSDRLMLVIQIETRLVMCQFTIMLQCYVQATLGLTLLRCLACVPVFISSRTYCMDLMEFSNSLDVSLCGFMVCMWLCGFIVALAFLHGSLMWPLAWRLTKQYACVFESSCLLCCVDFEVGNMFWDSRTVSRAIPGSQSLELDSPRLSFNFSPAIWIHVQNYWCARQSRWSPRTRTYHISAYQRTHTYSTSRCNAWKFARMYKDMGEGKLGTCSIEFLNSATRL